MDRYFLVIGALSAFMSVAAGAFGTHGLRGVLSDSDLNTFEIAVRYQMYHALALIAVALLVARQPNTALLFAGWCFVAGTLVFSGSLYVLTLTGQRWLGAVTPLGGVALLAGWLAFAWAAWQLSGKPS